MSCLLHLFMRDTGSNSLLGWRFGVVCFGVANGVVRVGSFAHSNHTCVVAPPEWTVPCSSAVFVMI